MSQKPYNLIFTLLIVSVLAVLALQGFWIQNFYQQKKEAFNLSIYASLEQISTRLNELDNLNAVKDDILITRSELPKKRSNFTWNTVVTKSTSYSQVINPKTLQPEVRIINSDTISNGDEKIVVKDSVIRIKNGTATIVSKTRSRTLNGTKSEIDRLMNKMLLEIKVIDSGIQNADTIKNVIKRVFNNKGLFLPFEFALKKVKHLKSETILQSSGFDDKAKSFIGDLSANRVFNTHTFLFVQLPGHNDLVLASMKNILIICLLFSALLMAVFYYSMRLILNQKKLSEIKNDFINNMTHELKTPIATISLATDAIKNPLIKNNDEKFRDYTRILKEENQKLNSHVERVLQMAMIEKGELQLNKKPLSLNILVQNSINSYKLQIQEQLANVRVSAGEDVIVNADEQHLQAVFNNLLDNALKYSESNCRVDISISKIEKEAVVIFKDNGIGIATEKQQKVFEKFYRVQGGNLHDVKGFGLGLSYVHSIISAHGGTINLVSEKGSGSEFTVRLKTNA